MSFDVTTFRSASDDNVPSFLRSPENGTTTAIRHDTLMEFSLIGKGVRVVNNDALANLIVRLHDPRATPIIVPPSSDLTFNEWFSQVHFEPDAVTGDFQFILEMANLQDARKLFLTGNLVMREN